MHFSAKHVCSRTGGLAILQGLGVVVVVLVVVVGKKLKFHPGLIKDAILSVD